MHSPLRFLRNSQGKTLREVAGAISLDTGNLSRIERGLQAASLDIAEKLAVFFEGQISELEILYPHRYQKDETNLAAKKPAKKPQQRGRNGG